MAVQRIPRPSQVVLSNADGVPLVNVDDLNNATTTPLSGGATFTGTWTDVLSFSAVTVIASSDAPGTLWYDFSADGVVAERSVQLSPGNTTAWGIHALAPVAQYGRIRVVNGAAAQGALTVQVLLSLQPRTIVSRAAQVINDYTDVTNVRVLSDVTLDAARGTHLDRTVVQKFGRNANVASNTEEDIWNGGGLYPWLTAAATVRVRAGGNVNDDAAGTGCRSVVVEGLDENWLEASETLVTAGASASAASTTTFIRVNRLSVLDVGTYTGANAALIEVETSGGTLVAVLSVVASASALGVGQSQMSMYTVPEGKEAFCRRVSSEVESTKSADIYFWQRQNADAVTAPFTGRRVWHVVDHLDGSFSETFASYVGPFPARTDLWVSAIGPSGGAGVQSEYDLILVGI